MTEAWGAQYLAPTKSAFAIWSHEEAVKHVYSLILNGITNPGGWKLVLAAPGRIEFAMECQGQIWRYIIIRLG